MPSLSSSKLVLPDPDPGLLHKRETRSAKMMTKINSEMETMHITILEDDPEVLLVLILDETPLSVKDLIDSKSESMFQIGKSFLRHHLKC